MKCANCLRDIVPDSAQPYGWTHDGSWVGVRCPNRIQPALPIGEQVAEDLRLLATFAQIYAQTPAINAQLAEVIDRWAPGTITVTEPQPAT